ncbi:hypothetical protein PFNF54_01993 [Plasmodium falciparum NF54]|uniref:Erythrocyte membrane protein 1 n=1 Tax=Plasmodium falciparum (isolate NF54) TaxID=5843 RepID=W7JX52_PLAFO|nr:hypothetical protein PFNF54_01993 [Plasmodium falciparum NF54]
MAPQRAEDSNKSAKEVLDEFGQQVYKEKVEKDAKIYKGELEGNLASSSILGETASTDKPCTFEYNKLLGARGKRHPCGNRQTVRFSDEYGGQCTFNRIKDSEHNNNDVGACAPFRRLHLCDYNLEKMGSTKIKDKNVLLAEVCMAAKYEGQSLLKQYEEHKNNYPHTNICTVLARSFADIGDIVRGKDLFLGHQQRKRKLEENLKQMFENIKKNNDKLDKISIEQVREYWWNANRDQVWEAITCHAAHSDEYFRKSTDGVTLYFDGRCGRELSSVPTYLDYVPQFLRWFDEWSEEFCRKRNITLKSAKEECQNDSKKLYCSLNGYNCTRLIPNKNYCSRDPICTPCSNKCIPYDLWLRNRRDEFNMQKGKYENEIKTYESDNDISNSNINTEYYKSFYKKFAKSDYKKVHDFLTLLNNGRYCKEGVDGKDAIDFNKTDDKDAFDRSEYCQPCPACVVECDGGKCEEKKNSDGTCIEAQIYTVVRDETPTPIKVLFSGDHQKDITKKLSSFCKNPESENNRDYQTWQCYYKSSDYNNCEMKGSLYKVEGDPNIIVSHECFHLWVQSLLIDTIKWETKLKKCINNTNVTNCYNKCNKNCECFENWVEQKKKEWENVNDVYKDQKQSLGIYYEKLENLFKSNFFQVMKALEGDEKGKWYQFKDDLKKKFEPSEKNTRTTDSQDAIKLILDHLKDNATTCKDNNSLEEDENCPKTKINPCIKRTRIPTRGASNNLVSVKHIAELMQRSARKQLEAGAGEINLKGDATKGKYTKKNGKAVALNDICSIDVQHSNSTYRSEKPCAGKNTGRFDIGTPWKTGTNVKMTEDQAYMPPRREHMCTSNLEYLETDQGPLKNSDGKFVNHSFLGDVLLAANHEAKKIKELYTKDNGLNDLKDKETVCRAMKYSFADLGDIIRGRDMWDNETGMKHAKKHLKDVFDNIRKSLKNKGNQKYNYDDKKLPPYKELREDWWEANRHQVWRAMKCAIKEATIDNCNGIPIEDYIPQRLRWMTEWAEWYCKMQSQEYKKLQDACTGCKKKVDSCTKGTPDCEQCDKQCKQYTEFITKWQPQWETMSYKYQTLYEEAERDATSGSVKKRTQLSKEDQRVVDFLKQLLLRNSAAARNRVIRAAGSSATGGTTAMTPNTPYSTAAGYIHHELGKTVGCNVQTKFCKHKIGSKASGTENKEYAFREKPYDHDDACACRPPKPTGGPGAGESPARSDADSRGPATVGAGEVEEDGDEVDSEEEEDEVEEEPPAEEVCEMVDTLLDESNGGKNGINGCNPKDQVQPYPGWDCKLSTFKDKEHGSCMPPRRIKLCVSGLTQTNNIINKEDIRTHFITCAAIETYFAWLRYKKINTEADKELKEGKIPDEFKRQMFYTFGDYRDIFFGTDISTHNHIPEVSSKVITILEKENGTKSEDKQKFNNVLLEDWWKEHGPEIWEGMLCALTNGLTDDEKKNEIKTKYSYDELNNAKKGDSSLEEFAQTSQFLRWMTEWGEDFCKKRKEQVETLQKACKFYECNINAEDTKTKCEKECKVYEQFIKQWKPQYEQQSKKFTTDKVQPEYAVDADVKKSTHAYQYLSKKLKKICQNGTTTDKCDYKCMENASRQPQTSACSQEQQQQNKSSTENNYPEAFDCPPKEIADKCNCPKPPEPKYCVDKTAYDIRKEREKKSDNSLKGNGTDIPLTDCTKVDTITFFNDNIGTTTINEKEMYKVFPPNSDSCDNKSSNRFNSEKQWLCNNINLKKKNICLPPRRQYMCLRKIERMITKDVDDKDKFFQVVMKAAKEEGIRILKNYKEQNKTDFSEICDDMKYSFADLGDIIRGKDLWNTDKNYKNIQDKIRYVFDYMHKKLNSDDQKRYKDLVNHYDLRSDWWDANRRDIWKAMTCAAPRNAYIYKTTENSETKIRSTDMYYYCGHKDDPPDNDYIPQKLRWMTEWSEYFCKELNRKLEQMKTNCDSCKLNDSNCRDSNDGNNCRKCQQNCQEYTKLVNQGKKQFILQDNQYKEIYKKISNNSDGKAYVGTHVVEFLKKVEKNKCSDLNSADKYLYKGSNCKNLTFTENDNEHRTRTYAFTEKPIEYKNKCTCEITNHPLDKCPTPQNRIICNNLKLINSYKKNYTINLKEWNNNLVPKISSDNYGVLVPPRRKHICLRNITANFLENKIYGKEKLRNAVLNAAYNEAYFLWTVYNKDSTTAFEAIKYSFADYGDIIKGTDIMESSLSDKIGNIFTNTKDTNARSKWWNEIKYQVWHAMLCGYRTANDKFVIDADTCKLPTEDEIPQFHRWLIEWAKQACKEYRIRKSAFEQFCHCSTAGGLSGLDLLKNHSCNYELTQYIGWNTMVKQYMDGFDIKFQKVKNASTNSSISENSAQEYIKGKIEGNECDFNDMENIYEKITNRKNKDFQEILGILCPNKKIDKDKSKEILDETSSKPKEEDTSHVQPPPLPPKPSTPEVEPLPSDEPFDPTILQTTIPFGVALALGSIAFLFLKKKTLSPVDLFSVINIPKGDYNIPTLKSSNRYIPYASDRYKGKTYIYMEGDSSGDEKYAFMSDTTDITSSESEYEELDINDIYVPRAPKYKTLIEVVLEPSKSNGNTLGDDIPHTNKFTDEEWNELKHDFISQYVQRESMGVPQYDVSTELPMNIGGNVLDDGINEKPFIMSIHDRNLYSGEEYSYNVNMVNSMDDIPINRDNNVYSGIDLINDTLSGNKHIDIYDEVLKRKENELFGTNHTKKNTSTNSVAKNTNSDPILNQINLFHTWLDRHRDMCEKLKNDNERLAKLKEEWENETHSGNTHPSDSNKTLNTDVSIQIHMDNPKPINQFTNMDTILEDLEKYNEPYYDVQDDIYYDVNDHDASTVDKK